MNYEIRFDIAVPEDIKKEELIEWIKFEIEMQASVKYTDETLNLEWDDLKPRFLILSARGG